MNNFERDVIMAAIGFAHRFSVAYACEATDSPEYEKLQAELAAATGELLLCVDELGPREVSSCVTQPRPKPTGVPGPGVTKTTRGES